LIPFPQFDVAVFEFVPVLVADLDDDGVPVWEGVFDWEADVDPVIVLITDGATDDPATEEAANEPTEGATDDPATEEATTDELATTDDPAILLPAMLLAAMLLAFTLAFNVLLRVSVRENVLFVHWNLITRLLLESATSKKTPGKSDE
jgi:hypothetical protein